MEDAWEEGRSRGGALKTEKELLKEHRKALKKREKEERDREVKEREREKEREKEREREREREREARKAERKEKKAKRLSASSKRSESARTEFSDALSSGSEHSAHTATSLSPGSRPKGGIRRRLGLTMPGKRPSGSLKRPTRPASKKAANRPKKYKTMPKTMPSRHTPFAASVAVNEATEFNVQPLEVSVDTSLSASELSRSQPPAPTSRTSRKAKRRSLILPRDTDPTFEDERVGSGLSGVFTLQDPRASNPLGRSRSPKKRSHGYTRNHRSSRNSPRAHGRSPRTSGKFSPRSSGRYSPPRSNGRRSPSSGGKFSPREYGPVGGGSGGASRSARSTPVKKRKHGRVSSSPVSGVTALLRRKESGGPFKISPTTLPYVEPKAFEQEELQRETPALSHGKYGVVYMGKVIGISQKVVIKDIVAQNEKTIREWHKEIQIMAESRSPYIAEVYGYCRDEPRDLLSIIMEYCENGDLYGVIHKHPERHSLSLLQRLRMARHCALGLGVLHRNKIMHRDIKSLNVLVTDDYRCKLTDFGLSKQLYIEQTALHTVATGTPLWMAPETRLGSNYDYKSDIYSLGLVFYELFDLKLPLWDSTNKEAVLPKSFFFSSYVRVLVMRDPNDRPTAKQVVVTLDKVIRSLMRSLRELLSKDDRHAMTLKMFEDSTTSSSNPTKRDHLDTQLYRLYHHLLELPSAEVDALIKQVIQNAYQEKNS